MPQNKQTTLLDYLQVTNVDPKAMPQAKVWAFVGLPKRGKTYGASRFNLSGDLTKTLYLDLEMCTLEYPEYNGLRVLPVSSYEAPLRPALDDDGKEILNSDKQVVMERIPVKERGLYINKVPMATYSVREALHLIKSMDKEGMLKKFESLVVDTIDKLQGMTEEHTIMEWNKKNPSDPVVSVGEIGEYGSGWDAAKKKLMNIILELKAICARNSMELVLCIHSKTTTQLKGKQQRDPALRQGNTLTLFGECSAIGYIDNEPTNKADGEDNGTVYNGKQYTVSFVTNSEETTGGSRFNKLVGKTLPFSYLEIKKEYEK